EAPHWLNLREFRANMRALEFICQLQVCHQACAFIVGDRQFAITVKRTRSVDDACGHAWAILVVVRITVHFNSTGFCIGRIPRVSRIPVQNSGNCDIAAEIIHEFVNGFATNPGLVYLPIESTADLRATSQPHHQYPRDCSLEQTFHKLPFLLLKYRIALWLKLIRDLPDTSFRGPRCFYSRHPLIS